MNQAILRAAYYHKVNKSLSRSSKNGKYRSYRSRSDSRSKGQGYSFSESTAWKISDSKIRNKSGGIIY